MHINLEISDEDARRIDVFRRATGLPALDREYISESLAELQNDAVNAALNMQGYTDEYVQFEKRMQRQRKHKTIEEKTGLHLYLSQRQIDDINERRRMFHMPMKDEDEVEEKMDKLIETTVRVLNGLFHQLETTHDARFKAEIMEKVKGMVAAAERESVAIHGDVEAFDMEEHAGFWKAFVTSVAGPQSQRHVEVWFHV
jgi:hypothetical protein